MFDTRKIANEEEYIIFNGYNLTKYEYYPIKIKLSSTKSREYSKDFTFYLYEGLMNKINVFLNVFDNNRTFFYEFFYYNLDESLKGIEKLIKINNDSYTINIGDDFGSENRKRFSVLNAPY